MRNYLILILVSVLLSNCAKKKYHNKNYTNEDKMMTNEVFDIESFNKKRWGTMPHFDEELGLWGEAPYDNKSSEDTLADGTTIYRSVSNFMNTGVTEYSETILPPNTVFCTYLIFYETGKLKRKFTKSKIIGTYSFIPNGIQYHFDENGMLIDKKDYTHFYDDVKVTPDSLFQILEREKIYDMKERPEGVLYVWFHSERSESSFLNRIPFKKGDRPYWEVTRQFMNPKSGPYKRTFKIDALSGEITEFFFND